MNEEKREKTYKRVRELIFDFLTSPAEDREYFGAAEDADREAYEFSAKVLDAIYNDTTIPMPEAMFEGVGVTLYWGSTDLFQITFVSKKKIEWYHAYDYRNTEGAEDFGDFDFSGMDESVIIERLMLLIRVHMPEV